MNPLKRWKLSLNIMGSTLCGSTVDGVQFSAPSTETPALVLGLLVLGSPVWLVVSKGM